MSVFDKSGSMLCQLQAPIYGFTNNKSLSYVYDCPLFAAEATLSHTATYTSCQLELLRRACK